MRTFYIVFCVHTYSCSVMCDVCRRDPEGVFSEPVTDDIAPNYSTIIAHPMDLATMATKIENSQYPSINEFKVNLVEI